MLLQPLAIVVIVLPAAFITRIAVRNAKVAPMMIPCTTPEPDIHARTLAISPYYHCSGCFRRLCSTRMFHWFTGGYSPANVGGEPLGDS
jgi:hypothetical protein